MNRRRSQYTLAAIGAVVLVAVSAQEMTMRPPSAFALEPPGQAAHNPEDPRPQFAQAGVCSRCHVNVVLEWGISGHVEAGTTCRECHGASEAHVANERNEIPPDRLPRGGQIAELCSTCHLVGCPKTLELESCSSCHHVHALINPKSEKRDLRDEVDERLRAVLDRWNRYRQQIAEGEQFVREENWPKAVEAYRKALELEPGKRDARERIAYCLRRQNPDIPGMLAVTEKIDSRIGLPSDVLVQPLNLRMALVPGGAVDLGDERFPGSQPVHTVAVEAFYLGCFEVAQAQWQAVMGANPSHHQGERFPNASQMPVEQVSWNDAQEFIHKINARIPGGGFRLPTEAEWEFACRAGQSESLGEQSQLEQLAWYRSNSRLASAENQEIVEIDDFAPRAVGEKAANRWGLYDLRGNVAEWCSSRYWPYLYRAFDGREDLVSDPATSEPLAEALFPTNWPKGMRVVRGGGYVDAAEYCDPAFRHANRPDRRFRWLGFRLARSIPTIQIAGE